MTPLQVLLVDDSEDIRFLSRLALASDPDFEVSGEAANGTEAIALAAASRPDAIVLDIEMPVMDGLTALPLLRALHPSVPVIVMTAWATPEVQREALRLGAHTVLNKSTRGIEQLVPALRAACSTVTTQGQNTIQRQST